MLRKNNGALFVILLIITAIYILRSHNGLVIESLPWLMVGMALLLLYHNKRKVWALIFGVILSGLSLLSALEGFGINAITFAQVFFFFIPGAIFMTLFLTKSMQGLLFPASLLLWAGFGLFLKNFFQIRGGSILTICVGMALITVYLLGSLRSSRGFLSFGMIICAFGVSSFLRQYYSVSYRGLGWAFVAVLIVMVIVKSRKGKGDTDGDDFN